MASRRGGEFWLGMLLGLVLVVGWLLMLGYNAMPYLQGGVAAQPPLVALLTQLVTPPALATVIAPELAALAGWALAVVIVTSRVQEFERENSLLA